MLAKALELSITMKEEDIQDNGIITKWKEGEHSIIRMEILLMKGSGKEIN